MISLVVLILASLALTTNALNETIFKTCSERDFCNRLRDIALDKNSRFAAIISEIVMDEGTVSLPLRNKNGDELSMSLDFLSNSARIKIMEYNSTRFELRTEWVLKNDPEKFSYSFTNFGNKSINLIPDDQDYGIILENGPPFVVSFYQNEQREVILTGEKLLMEYTNDSQVFAFSVDFEAEKLYGLFDHAWNLALGNTIDLGIDPFRFRNSDSWGYEANSPAALYGTIPAIYGHSSERTGGIFLHNAAEQWIDIYDGSVGPAAYFMVEGGVLDLFVFLGPTPKDIVRQFTGLTGRAPLPQLWTLGYHQCRFSYKSTDDVKEVANLMVQKKIPMDAIWIDGDHTDDYRWFQWNHTTYTDPIEMFNNISSLNKVAVSISDPHIKVDDDYEVYQGAKGKYFVKLEDGSDYQAECWPGNSSWIDFLNEEASEYYGSWYSYDKFKGTTATLAGIWNDMNEPAVFDDDTEKTMPFEAVHHIDEDTSVLHRDVHNIYGMLHTHATFNGLLARDNNETRPFILSRSTFAGSQRVAAMWTGDNTASWEHFAISLSQCMTGNILGMVLCGADIGGFIGDPSDELLQRWYQGAVWTPFFRGHSSRESARREPYLFDNDVQEVIRSAIQLRYKHIPFLYKLFYEHSMTGDPILSPLFYHYPGVHERDTQMLIGGDIMAVAVVNESVSSVEVLFPGTKDQIWYRVDNDSWVAYYGGDVEDVEVDINTSPVFYRGGSIITRKDDVKLSTFETRNDSYTFYVNLDINNEASGTFYEDDFSSYNYQNEKYLYLNVKYDHSTQWIHFEVIDGDGDDFNPSFHQIVVHSPPEEMGSSEVGGKIHAQTRHGVKLGAIDVRNEILRSADKKFIIQL